MSDDIFARRGRRTRLLGLMNDDFCIASRFMPSNCNCLTAESEPTNLIAYEFFLLMVRLCGYERGEKAAHFRSNFYKSFTSLYMCRHLLGLP